MTATLACLLASAAPLLLLIAWARLYPLTEMALLAPLIAALLAFLALFRAFHARRRAIAETALAPGARLRPLFAGRIGSALLAAPAAVLPLPAIAYFTLTAGALSWLAIALLAALGCLWQLTLRAPLARELREAFRPAFAVGLVTFASAAPVALLHGWLDYTLAPLPAWIDAPDYPAMLGASLGALPGKASWVREVFAAMCSLEVGAYWLLKLDQARSLPLLLFIACRDTLVFFGLAAWLAALQSLAIASLPPGDANHHER